MTSLLRTFRASFTTGCAALHGSLNMRESIFLNNNEMVSFYWVDVEIERRGGDFLDALHPMFGAQERISHCELREQNTSTHRLQWQMADHSHSATVLIRVVPLCEFRVFQKVNNGRMNRSPGLVRLRHLSATQIRTIARLRQVSRVHRFIPGGASASPFA
jgi:hypothetical protein